MNRLVSVGFTAFIQQLVDGILYDPNRDEANSDGYYFTDSASGTLIEVTGTLIITILN